MGNAGREREGGRNVVGMTAIIGGLNSWDVKMKRVRAQAAKLFPKAM